MSKSLDKSIVSEIRTLYTEGYSVKELCEVYDVSRSKIYRITSDLRQQKERVVETVTQYLPSYKKQIQPKCLSACYSHGDVNFTISQDSNYFSLSSRGTPNLDFSGGVEIIDDIISNMENTIGVLMFIKDVLQKQKL